MCPCQGFTESGGLELDAAAELYRKSGALPDQLQATFDVADVDGDGVLDLRQFCLFMVLVKALRAEDAPMLPHSLSPAQVTHMRLLAGLTGALCQTFCAVRAVAACWQEQQLMSIGWLRWHASA